MAGVNLGLGDGPYTIDGYMIIRASTGEVVYATPGVTGVMKFSPPDYRGEWVDPEEAEHVD